MADLNTKKWFIYVGDKHEGPYSLVDVQQKMAQGVVTQQHYVWCDGMGDWKMMTDVPDFSAVLSGGAPAEPAPVMDFQSLEPQPYGSDEVAVAEPANDGATTVGKLSLEDVMPAQAGAVQMDEAPELDTGSFAAPKMNTAPVQQAAPVQRMAATGFGSSAVAVADNEKTGDINPKERKRLEKEAKKAAKLAEKERKIREKLEAKENTLRAKQAKLLGVGSGGMSARGGERFAPKFIKFLFLILMIAGAGAAYLQGYLDPVLNHPQFQSSVEMIKSAARPYVKMAIEKVPMLGQFISPIPALPDVEPVEYEAMKLAALSQPETSGGKVAVGLSLTDPLKPKFYLASNMPDGTSFEFMVIGVPETLLNQLKYVIAKKAVVQGNFAEIEPLDFQGKPVPRGTYRVFVVESAKQPPEVMPVLAGLAPAPGIPSSIPPGRKVFGTGTFFLGGRKDASYTERLKIYHDNLQKVSASELVELKQVTMTFQGQLNSTLAKFKSMRKGRVTAATRSGWQSFDKGWSGMMAQFEQTYQSWSPEFLEGRFFHWRIYGMVKTAGIAISQVHAKHRQYFDGGAQDPNFDTVLGQFVSEAQSVMAQLQSGISQVESLAPSPNGMPARL